MGVLTSLRLIIVVRVDILNKELGGDTGHQQPPWGLWKLLACALNHKEIMDQLDFIGAFLQEKVTNRVFLNLDSRYVDYFPEYSN